MISTGKIERGSMKDVLLHMIADDVLMNDLSAATKLVPSPILLHRLKEAGRTAADAFLRDQRGSRGRETTVPLDEAML